MSDAVARGYQEEVRSQVASRDDAVERFIDALRRGESDGTEQLARSLGSDPADMFRAACILILLLP